MFQRRKGSPAGIGKAEQVRAGTIERDFTLRPLAYEDIVSATGVIYSVQGCGEGCRRFRIIGDGNCSSAPPIFTARFEVSDPAKLLPARIVEMGADDWVHGRIKENGRSSYRDSVCHYLYIMVVAVILTHKPNNSITPH